MITRRNRELYHKTKGRNSMKLTFLEAKEVLYEQKNHK